MRRNTGLGGHDTAISWEQPAAYIRRKFYVMNKEAGPYQVISIPLNSPPSSQSRSVCTVRWRLRSFKGKVVLVFFTEHHAMKAYWGVEE
jgi:hypothetical protein